MSKKWIYLIAISLLINFLLIGVLIGVGTSSLLGHKPFPPPPPMMHSEGGKLLREMMAKNREKHWQLNKRIQQVREKTHEVLSQKIINEAEYFELTEQLKALHNEKFSLITNELLNTAKQLPSEKRQELTMELERRPPPPPLH